MARRGSVIRHKFRLERFVHHNFYPPGSTMVRFPLHGFTSRDRHADNRKMLAERLRDWRELHGRLTDRVDYSLIPHPSEVTSKEQAHDLAVSWQHWMSKKNLSWDEMHAWQAFFVVLAERYGLAEEFTENAII